MLISISRVGSTKKNGRGLLFFVLVASSPSVLVTLTPTQLIVWECSAALLPSFPAYASGMSTLSSNDSFAQPSVVCTTTTAANQTSSISVDLPKLPVLPLWDDPTSFP